MLLVCSTNVMAYAINIQTATCQTRSCGFVDINPKVKDQGNAMGVRGFERLEEAKTINKRHDSYMCHALHITGTVSVLCESQFGVGLTGSLAEALLACFWRSLASVKEIEVCLCESGRHAAQAGTAASTYQALLLLKSSHNVYSSFSS